MNKQRQWAIVTSIWKMLAESSPDLGERQLHLRVKRIMSEFSDNAPWAYPWQDVVESVAEQRRNRLAKSQN